MFSEMFGFWSKCWENKEQVVLSQYVKATLTYMTYLYEEIQFITFLQHQHIITIGICLVFFIRNPFQSRQRIQLH